MEPRQRITSMDGTEGTADVIGEVSGVQVDLLSYDGREWLGLSIVDQEGGEAAVTLNFRWVVDPINVLMKANGRMDPKKDPEYASGPTPFDTPQRRSCPLPTSNRRERSRE